MRSSCVNLRHVYRAFLLNLISGGCLVEIKGANSCWWQFLTCETYQCTCTGLVDHCGTNLIYHRWGVHRLTLEIQEQVSTTQKISTCSFTSAEKGIIFNTARISHTDTSDRWWKRLLSNMKTVTFPNQVENIVLWSFVGIENGIIGIHVTKVHFQLICSRHLNMHTFQEAFSKHMSGNVSCTSDVPEYSKSWRG